MNDNNKSNTNMNSNNNNNNNMNSEFIVVDYNVIKNSEMTIEKAVMLFKEVVYTVEVHYNNNIKSVDAIVGNNYNLYNIRRLIDGQMIKINNENYDLKYSYEMNEIIKYMLVKFHDVEINEVQYLV